MRVFSRTTLQDFWEKHPNSEQQLRSWFRETERATWHTFADIRKRYGSADVVVGDRAIFNICGNNYRLIVAIKYAPICSVYIRFVGTHPEYDAIDAKTI